MKRQTNLRRRLVTEQLESRRLMAADCNFAHNFESPEDTDGSGLVSPIDALRVINVLNSGVTQSAERVDVNADGLLSGLDALTVINHLNQSQAVGEQLASAVSVAARIARIEADLAGGNLPEHINLEKAQAILNTLRLGGAPELGDRVERGARFIERKLEALSERLNELGVEPATIADVVTDIVAEIEAGATDFGAVVKQALADNGVDIDALKSALKEQTRVAEIIDRLEAAGIDQTVIETLATDLRTAIEAGTPLTVGQIVERLRELGVDPSTLFGNLGGDHGHPVSVDEVTERLERWGVEASVIAVVVADINAAEEAGDPMTHRELFVLLRELGVFSPTRREHVARPVQRLLGLLRR